MLTCLILATMLTLCSEVETEDAVIMSRPELFTISASDHIMITEKATTQKMIVTPAEVIMPEPEPEPQSVYTYVGSYELTAYVWTGNPCADGVYPEVSYTCACNDPALWHKWIHIEGYGDYYVHDTGGMSSNVIDIFVGSYDEAINFGRRTAEVYIIED